MHNDRQLRIALVAPPWYPVPPPAYGGIEALVSWLAEGLVDHGHQVTVIGAGRPGTDARFIATCRVPPTDRLGEALPEVLHAAHAARLLDDLDVQVVHDHSLAGPLGAAGRSGPTVLTAHGRVDGELGGYYRHLGLGLVAISDFQRQAAPELPWVARVHNGIPVASSPYRKDKDEFCLFLGRMTPDKGPDLAILAAHAAGLPIVVAAKCSEPGERRYHQQCIRPLLGPDDVWVGEADGDVKRDLLGRARCLVFPVRWDEPFGLAPTACRWRAERLFDVAGMVAGYEQVYRQLVEPGRPTGRELRLLSAAAGAPGPRAPDAKLAQPPRELGAPAARRRPTPQP